MLKDAKNLSYWYVKMNSEEKHWKGNLEMDGFLFVL